MMHTELLKEIKKFCSAVGVAKSTFGRMAVNDGKFIARLENGGQCLPSTEQKVRDFMESYGDEI